MISKTMAGLMWVGLLMAVGVSWAQEAAPSAGNKAAPAEKGAALVRFPAIESGKVDVSIQDGEARLSGNVSTLLAKEQIAAAVSRLDGVYDVQNDIRVYAAGRRDLDIRTQIERGLVADPLTESFEVDVKVRDGAVVLSGIVQSRAELDAAARVAKSVPGVKALTNRLLIEPR